MKRKFWTYERNQERYKRERARLNNMYFQKLNSRGEQSAISKKIEKALQEVAKKSKKKAAGAGSSSQPPKSTGKGAFDPNSYEDVIEDEIKDAELNEILGSMGELDVKSMTKVLHNKVIANALAEMLRKFPKLVNEEIDCRQLIQSP